MDGPFSVKIVGKFTVVKFTTPSLVNPIDIERISKALGDLADERKSSHMLLDFAPVEHLSNQVIPMISNLQKKTSAIKVKGSGVTLCGVNAQLLQLLKLTGVVKTIAIAKNKYEFLEESKH